MTTRLLSTSAEELFPQNNQRKSFIIQNEDTSIALFIKFERPGRTSVSSTDHDHRLGPGASIGVNSLTDGEQEIQERVTIVAASGTPRVSFFETESVER